MDEKESERYFRGYIFVPCCTKECCRNQAQSFQTYPSLNNPYPVPKHEVFSQEQTSSFVQVPHQSSRFIPHRDGDYRLVFPAMQTDQLQPCEISRHNIDVESQLRSAYRLRAAVPENHFQAQRNWAEMEVGCKPKRNRTIFTADQLERLEKEFDRQQYIVGTQRFYLAADLGLNETQVKVWFQNRRIKWRRQNLESVCSSERSRFEVDGEERGL